MQINSEVQASRALCTPDANGPLCAAVLLHVRMNAAAERRLLNNCCRLLSPNRARMLPRLVVGLGEIRKEHERKGQRYLICPS